jgi:hypothetical protein
VIGPLGFFASPEPRGFERPLGGSVSIFKSLRARLTFGILLAFATVVPAVAAGPRFTTPPVYSVGGFGVETAGVATGDFNGDGKLDLVAANPNASTLLYFSTMATALSDRLPTTRSSKKIILPGSLSPISMAMESSILSALEKGAAGARS